MTELLFLSIPSRLEGQAQAVLDAFKKEGIPFEILNTTPKDGSLVLLFLDMDSTPEEIYRSAPWIKDQFTYSSFKALRLMPFLMYRSGEGSVEEQVENGLSDTLEKVMSGEFKPFGFDLDAKHPLEEFPSVYETYSE